MTHGELQDRIVMACRRLSLHAHHCRMLGSQRGFPDLVIVGRRGVLWRELKVPPDSLTSEQRALGYTLQAAGQDWAVWSPDQYLSGLIELELEGVS